MKFRDQTIGMREAKINVAIQKCGRDENNEEKIKKIAEKVKLSQDG